MRSSRVISRIKRTLLSPSNIISFIAGLIMVFSYAPYDQWWLAFPALIAWFSQIHLAAPKKAAQASYAFGLGWFGAGISWVHVSIDQFGGMPLVVSIALMVLLCAYLALFPALAGYLTARLSSNRQLNLMILPALWIATEWLRGWLLTGFPWLSVGYTQIDAPFSVLAPVIGEMGITLVMFITAVSVYLLAYGKLPLKKQKITASTLLILVLLGTVVTSQLTFTQETGETKSVALVQGNIAQELKWAA